MAGSGKIATAYVQVIPTTQNISSMLLKDFEPAGEQAGTAAGSASGKNFAAAALKAVTGSALIATAGKAIKAGLQYDATIESYSAALTTALGSGKAAAEAIEAIKKDAATTPYSVDGLIAANRYLISAGESAAASRETIMALTDAISASGGGNAELQRMAQNLQQVKNTGKATAMDIRQFANAGIDIYGILADYTGKSTAEVQELTVTYEMLAGALQQAAAEGGRYYGANAAQAATLNGQISTLTDNINSKLGEATAGVAKTLSGQVLPMINEFVSGLDVSKAIEDFKALTTAAVGVGAALAAVKAVNAFASLASGAKLARESFLTLSAGMTVAQRANGILNGQLSLSGALYATLSGQIGTATLAQTALNAVTTAAPFALVGAAVAGLVAVFNDYHATQERVAEGASLIVSETAEEAQSAEELAAKIAELREQHEALMEQLRSMPSTGWEALFNPNWRATSEKIQEIEKALGELVPKYEDLAAAEEKAAYIAGTSSAQTRNALNDTIAVIDELNAKYEEQRAAILKSVQGWYGPFDTATQGAKKNINEWLDAMKSQISFNADYSANLQKLTDYGLGPLGDAFAESGKDGAAWAAALVAAIEDAGGASSEGGQEIINSFLETQSELESSEQAITDSMAAMATGIEDALADAVSGMTASVAALDVSSEAKANAMASVQAYISGLSSGSSGAFSAAASVAASASRGFASGAWGAAKMASFDVGTDYVPHDMIAQIHQGEMIIPARISEDLRDFMAAGHSSESTARSSAPASGSITVRDNSQALDRIIDAIAVVADKLSRLRVVMDSGELVGSIAYEMDDALGEIAALKGA